MYIGAHVRYPLFLSEFDETSQFSRKIFKKYSNIKFRENPSSGSGVFPCGRTDGHDEANSRFSPFCARAQTYKTKSPTRLTVGSTVAATCTYCPFWQHSLQGCYFIRQLLAVTSCRLVYRTNAALSADRRNAWWSCSMKWQESPKQGSSVTIVNKTLADLARFEPR